MNELVMETADVRTCPHGYVFNSKCPMCSGWISVKDRLPVNDEIVLCKNDRSQPEVARFMLNLTHLGQERDYFFMAANEWKQYTGVSHWMTLTLPPEKENE